MFKDYKKGLIIFSLFFILILSLGAISASEDLDDQMVDSVSVPASDEDLGIVNENNGEIETNIGNSDSENSLSDETPSKTITVNGGTFEDIENATKEANDGDTIVLDGTFEGIGKKIYVSKPLTFKGTENTILDAKNLSEIFTVNYKTSFENLIFINSNRGAIFAQNEISVLNCIFENNTNPALEGGGAIYCNGNLNIDNCTFTNNFADNLGGAISSRGILHIVNSSFDKNTINESNFGTGGAVCSEMGTYINCSFSNCLNNNIQGRAVYSTFNCSFIDCTFENNTANLTKDYHLIYSENSCDIKSCEFRNCTNIIRSEKTCNVEDSNFTDNKVQVQYYNINGGVIECLGNLSVMNCRFENNYLNSTWGRGGAIFSKGSCSIMNCTFINNSASNGGGAVSSFGRYSYVGNCTFIGNVNPLENIKIVNGSYFENNTKPVYYDFDTQIGTFKTFYKKLGDNIYGEDFLVMDCSFDNNKEGAIGAYLFLDSFKNTVQFNLSVINCSFNSNKKKSAGSAFNLDGGYVQKLSANINFINSTFSNNLVTGNPSKEFTHFGNGTISYWGPINTKVNIVNCSGIGKNDDKFKTSILIDAPDVSMVYKAGKYLVATFTGSLGLIKNAKVTIKLNGKTFTKTTNSKGQVKLLLSSLIPKNYTATITWGGDNFNLKTSKSVKVVVKKATPKLSAANKAFKRKLRTKKYTVTLKNHKGTVLKSYKLTLRVKGKTFTAKTNSKGKATFKITNLSRKGTFKAVIKYTGNKYYKNISKTVKITAK